MRTTIDLDPDVDARLRAVARERMVPLRVVIDGRCEPAWTPLAVPPSPSPTCCPLDGLASLPGANIDKALARAGELEDEEILRKRELRK